MTFCRYCSDNQEAEACDTCLSVMLEEQAAENIRLREALEFIAKQTDKAGNWAVVMAKNTLAAESKGTE